MSSANLMRKAPKLGTKGTPVSVVCKVLTPECPKVPDGRCPPSASTTSGCAHFVVSKGSSHGDRPNKRVGQLGLEFGRRSLQRWNGLLLLRAPHVSAHPEPLGRLTLL